MARGINKVILIGNLGKDPEMRSMPSGGQVTNVTVATSESWKDKATGEAKEKTEWHTVVFFNRLAEIAGQYLKKGSKVYIEGSLRTRNWEKDGVTHYKTEVIANEMQMLDGKPGGSSAPMDREPASASGGARGRSQPSAAPVAADKSFEDDDIPF